MFSSCLLQLLTYCPTEAMVIGIDLRCLLESKPTGVTRYAIRLLPELWRDSPHTFRLLLTGRRAANVHLPWELPANVSVVRAKGSNRWLNIRYLLSRGPALDILAGGCDVFFMPCPLFGRVSPGVPLVLTVHDLAFARFPDMSSRYGRVWHRLLNPRRLARSAAKVIAVSQATKRDVVDLYGVEDVKVEVVYSGGESRIVNHESPASQIQTTNYKLQAPYLLMIGTKETRKNIPAAVAGFAAARRQGVAMQLVLVGKEGAGYEQIKRAIASSGFAQDCVELPYLSDAELNQVLRGAFAVLYPSLYEGFGFPILEAMAAGVPVITSAVSAMPEIGGNAALYVRPYRPEDITAALLLLQDETTRKRYSEMGLARAKEFSWEKAGREVIEVIRSVVTPY